jgi:hypothetical protein
VDCDGCCDCQGGCGCAGHDHDHHKHDHRNELQPDDTAYYGHPDGGNGHGLHRCRGSFKIISNPFPETIHPGASLASRLTSAGFSAVSRNFLNI